VSPKLRSSALRVGARPRDLRPDEEAALDFTRELLHSTWSQRSRLRGVPAGPGEQGVVELAALIGYFRAGVVG
jgi:hypothetical protein